MSKNFRPEDFLGCNLIDKTYLDEEGFLLSSAVNNGRELRKNFGRYMLDYSYTKKRGNLTFYLYFRGDPIGSIFYCQNYRPNFMMPRANVFSATREGFLEMMMPLDKDLAFWLLWNI
jgi:hypothetical protein